MLEGTAATSPEHEQRTRRACHAHAAWPEPAEVAAGRRAQRRSQRAAREVAAHEHGIEPAACLGGERVKPRLIGDERGPAAEVEHDHANNQPPQMMRRSRDRCKRKHHQQCADADHDPAAITIRELADGLRGEHAQHADETEQARDIAAEAVGRLREQERERSPKRAVARKQHEAGGARLA